MFLEARTLKNEDESGCSGRKEKKQNRNTENHGGDSVELRIKISIREVGE